MKRIVLTIMALTIALATVAMIPASQSHAYKEAPPSTVADANGDMQGPEHSAAESFQECLRQGCSSNDCSAATQNGFTCKTWRCFKGCLSGKGFRGSCHEELPNTCKY
jgi:hypothetical protein